MELVHAKCGSDFNWSWYDNNHFWGGIDISIGSIMAVCAMVFAGVLNSTGSLLFSFLVALGIAVICGVINGLVISRFKIQPMIATMAMMYILRSVAKVISNGEQCRFRMLY